MNNTMIGSDIEQVLKLRIIFTNNQQLSDQDCPICY